MKIAGLEKTSFVDYPGMIAAVVFTPGCNFDCFFCHNRLLLGQDAPGISETEVMEYLEARRGLVDAVVISGGEPLLQDGVEEFIIKLRAMGYLVKLDTNGSLPERLEALLEKGLLDYVAVDVKAPEYRHKDICMVDRPAGFLKTIQLLKNSGVPWEARTTMVPQLSVEDMREMLCEIAPLPRYAVQAYRQPEDFLPQHRFMANAAPYTPAQLDEFARAAEEYAVKVVRRG